MSIIHLSDEQLQLYLDDGSNEKSSFIEEHLRCCEQCRQQLAAYHSVIDELNTEPENVFSPGFESIIIDKIQEKANKILKIKNFFFHAAAIVFVMIISIYVFMSAPISENMVRIFVDKWIGAKYLYDSVLRISGDLDISLKVLVSAGIILFFYGLFDRILVTLKSKKFSLFSVV